MTTQHGEGGHGSSICTARGTRCCCPTRGTRGRRACWPRSAFRRWPPRAARQRRCSGAATDRSRRDEAIAPRGEHRGYRRAGVGGPGERLRRGAGGAKTIRRSPAAPGWRADRSRTSAGARTTPLFDTPARRRAGRAAAAAAHAGPSRLVLTARAENYLHGRPDLADTIARLQRVPEAGADVLYAPGLSGRGDPRLVASVDRPVNVLALGDGPGVAELAGLGVGPDVGRRCLRVRRPRRGGRRGPGAPRTGTYGYLASSAAGQAIQRAV